MNKLLPKIIVLYLARTASHQALQRLYKRKTLDIDST